MIRTPLRPQFQTTECGVAVLRIMFAHFGFEPSVAEIRAASGVSRDCVSATDIRRTARAFGFDCKAMSVETPALAGMALPVIVHLSFIHFVVLEAIEADHVRLNCPAHGHIAVAHEEFDARFTGIVLALAPSQQARQSARERRAERDWWRWVASAVPFGLSTALRRRITAQFKVLPLSVLAYRLPEKLYGLVGSGQWLAKTVHEQIVPATAGALGALLVMALLAHTAPSTALGFAGVFAAWLGWVWFWSRWRLAWGRGEDDGGSIAGAALTALTRPQTMRLGDGPDRLWRGLTETAARRQAIDLKVRPAATALRHAPDLLLLSLLGALALVDPGAPAWLVTLAALLVLLAEPLVRLRGILPALRVAGFHWRDILEEPVGAPVPTLVSAAPAPIVSVEKLSFGFTPTKPVILANVDLRIDAGEQVALVGPSGCGKSTLTKIIVGIHAATAGRVVLASSARVLRVDRHVTMFEASLRDNLTLWDETITAADLDAAVTDAGLAPILAQRSGGLDCRVEPYGANFSGGQLQRIEIARALARRPSLLILDDALDALDPASERNVRAALRRRGCALLLASHRASSIAACDRIVEVGGRLAAAAAVRPSACAPMFARWTTIAPGERIVGDHEHALHDAIDRLAPSSDPEWSAVADLPLATALDRLAERRGYRMRRLDIVDPSWWLADFGPVLALRRDGSPVALDTARLSGCERRMAAATYEAHAYAFAPRVIAPLETMADWWRGAGTRGARDMVRVAAATIGSAIAMIALLIGAARPMTLPHGIALVVLAGCGLSFLMVRARAAQRFEGATRTWEVHAFTALVERTAGDVLGTLSPVRVLRGLMALGNRTRRIEEMVAAVLPAGIAFVAALVALGAGSSPVLRPSIWGVLAAIAALPVAVAALSYRGSQRALEAGLLARRHLAIAVWGLAKLRLIGAQDRAFARWIILDRASLRLVGRRRAITLVAGTAQALATLALIALAAGSGHSPILLGAVAWVLARSSAVLGGFLANLCEDRAAAADVAALLAEAPTPGAIAVDGGAPITVHDATVRYGTCRDRALDGVSVAIMPGEVTVLAGPSGGGKSTLLRVILGLQRLESGTVRIDGQQLHDVDVARWRRGIAGVFQGDQLEDTVTIRGQLCAGGDYPLDALWSALAAVELAEEIGAFPMGLQTIVEAGSLSTGQQQRLLIAAALLRRPRLMILDEATNAIPDALQARIVRRLRERGTGCVVVTHRETMVALADRVHVLVAGRLIFSGVPADAGEALGSLAQRQTRT